MTSKQVLDHLLKRSGTSYAQVEREAQLAEQEEREGQRKARLQKRLDAEKARRSEHEKVGRAELGKTLFVRADRKIIMRERDLICPYCGAALPELGAHVAAAGEVFQNRVDRGGRPWTRSSLVTCSKCQRKYELLTVLM